MLPDPYYVGVLRVTAGPCLYGPLSLPQVPPGALSLGAVPPPEHACHETPSAQPSSFMEECGLVRNRLAPATATPGGRCATTTSRSIRTANCAARPASTCITWTDATHANRARTTGRTWARAVVPATGAKQNTRSATEQRPVLQQRDARHARHAGRGRCSGRHCSRASDLGASPGHWRASIGPNPWKSVPGRARTASGRSVRSRIASCRSTSRESARCAARPCRSRPGGPCGHLRSGHLLSCRRR